MKRRLSSILFAAVIFIIVSVTSVGAENMSEYVYLQNMRSLPRLMDEADLLTDEEEQALLQKLDEISLRQGMDVVVVTVYSLGGISAADFADDYFDNNGYGQGSDRSGVLLLHSPEERDWYISTSGYGITAFTDYGLEYIGNMIVPHLADGNYLQAYCTFAEECDSLINQAKQGNPFDYGRSSNSLPISAIFISIAIGVATALIIVGIMKKQLNPSTPSNNADSYVREGSFEITSANEVFLYRTHTRQYIGGSSGNGRSGGSSTHRSSSGSRHGGRGGKY